MNSELETIKALSASAVKKGKIHKIIFMIDIGDLREGCLPENALNVIGEIVKLKGVRLDGIGANFGCFGGVMPEYDNLHILVELAKKIKSIYGIDLTIISGGNSFTYTTMVEGQCPKEINHFRLGDILLTGYDTRLMEMVPGAEEDAIVLLCEIRKRAIFAVGRQDIRIEEVFPLEKGMEILGASSDHMIVDVTDHKGDLKVGSIVPFRLTYGALLAAFTSEYVEKTFI
jgi:predicted amino acid racemase